MNVAETNYIEQQLFKLAPLPITEANFPYGFDIQILNVGIKYFNEDPVQTGGKTNFLRITADQMRRIEEVLRSDV